MKYADMTVGRRYWVAVRDLVERMNFRGHNIEIFESPGEHQRLFTFKGDDESLRLLKAAIDTELVRKQQQEKVDEAAEAQEESIRASLPWWKKIFS